MDNPYLELTRAFNDGRLRAVLSSGQAVVLYRLTVMSKDGDWVVHEDEEALAYVLAVLGRRGASYRYGAPLDRRWLAGGWSAHFEHFAAGLRLRTDFVSRPPRVSPRALERLWQAPVIREVPVVGLAELAEMKKTDREKDYPVIGELARLMEDPRERLLYSRSSRDLLQLAREAPELVADLRRERPVLAVIEEGRQALERALDEERRTLMRRNEERLDRYRSAARPWSRAWPGLQKRIAGLPLAAAHQTLVAAAEDLLPFEPD
jgi:hypothetical protein